MVKRQVLETVRYTSNKFKSASVRMTKWTGKSSVYIHPKHLVKADDKHTWVTDTLHRTDKVLDIGCGTLAHSLRAAAKTAYVTSFDYDIQLLRRNQQQIAEKNIGNIGLFQGSAETTLPFANQSFDKVIFLDVLEHLHNRDLILSDIYRVLADDGLIYLAVPNVDTKWKRWFKGAGLFYYADADHKIEYTQETLADELNRNGFQVVGNYLPIVYDTPWVGIIDFIGGLSLPAYQRLSQQRHKFLERHPEETTGWCVVCQKVLD